MAVAIGLLLGSVAFASPTLSPSLAPPTSSTAVVVVEGKEKRPARSRALLTYHIQKALKLNIGLKIMLIMCLSIPIVTFLGFLNYMLTGQDFLGSIFKSYAILADVPGADALDGQADDLSGKNVWSVLCFNAAYFIGVFTFAVFLGLLVNDIGEPQPHAIARWFNETRSDAHSLQRPQRTKSRRSSIQTRTSYTKRNMRCSCTGIGLRFPSSRRWHGRTASTRAAPKKQSW